MKFHDVSIAMTEIVQQMLERLGEYGAIEDLYLSDSNYESAEWTLKR